MKAAVLLATSAQPAACAPLVEALTAAGLRTGWLELGPVGPPPARLESAAAAGVLRAVAAVGGRVVSVKPVVGEPVLSDLLREHFRGCALVLVSGGAGLPGIEPEGDGWRVSRPGRAEVRWSTAELVRALGRPSAWAPPA